MSEDQSGLGDESPVEAASRAAALAQDSNTILTSLLPTLTTNASHSSHSAHNHIHNSHNNTNSDGVRDEDDEEGNGTATNNDENDDGIDEDDEENLFEMVTWFSKEGDVLPSIAKKYAKLLISDGIGSINRLAKRINKEGRSVLSSLGFKNPDIDDIVAALIKKGFFDDIEGVSEQTIPVKSPSYPSHESTSAIYAASASSPAHSTSSPDPSSAVAHGESGSDAEAAISPTTPHGHATNSHGHTSSRLSVLFSPVTDSTNTSHDPSSLASPSAANGAGSGASAAGERNDRRKSIGHLHRSQRNNIYFRNPQPEVLAESEKIVENLKTALETKMEMAIIGVLQGIATAVIGSSEKQRSFFLTGAPDVIVSGLNSNMDKPAICEKFLIVAALLCRHSDDSKISVCLENAKALGAGGIIPAMLATMQRHSGDNKILEATCDAVRCLCVMESNRSLMSEAGMCEAIGRALGMTKFMHLPECCAWLCRAIGHLSNGSDTNRSKLASVGACESAVAALQFHMANANVCADVCWAIRNLAPIESNRIKFADEFGPESILSVMKTFKYQEIFMVEAFKAIIAMIENEQDEVVERIGNGGIIPFAVKSIRKNPSSENLARWGFHVLYFLAADPQFWPSLMQNDILDVISTTLQEHASDEGVAEWGCRNVHELAGVEGISAKMRNVGMCEMVVSCVQRQAMSPSVSGWGCLAIGDLAMDKGNHSRLSQSGACEAVVGALKRHDDDDQVVFKTCHAIHFLTTTENNVSWMGANAGCEAITQALIKHTVTSLPACRYALKALGSLGLHDEGNLLRFHHAGACPAVVNALKTHIADELVAEHACRAIYYLCTEPINVSQLGKAGAPRLVVTVLQALAHNPDVVTKSCLAIYGLAVKTKTDKVHTGNTRKLVNKGAIDSVVAAMSKSPDDPELVRAGCMAIASLARLDENKIKLGTAGALKVILNGFSTHPNNERVVAQLIFATEAMCNGNDDNKTNFANAGIIDILLAAQAKHERNKFVAGESFRALITFSTHDACKLKIRSDAAVKLGVKVFKLHEKESKVAKWGCNWVYACATDDVVRERLGNAKACESVVAVLQKHAAASCDVLVWGCKALIGLSALESNLWRFCNTDTCAAIVTGFKVHGEDLFAAEWACCAIVRLAHNEQNRTRIGVAGGCAAVSASLTKLYHASVDVVKLACEAIYFLSQDETNKQLLGAAGACETLVTCLSTHLANPDVADRVCKAIAGLTKYSTTIQNENASKCGAAGACELLLSTLKSHIFHGIVVEWGCAAVASLADRNPKNQATFCATPPGINAKDPSSRGGGACALLVTVLVTHRSNAVVCAQASRATRALTTNNTENNQKFSVDGIVPACMKVLKTHKDDDSVVEHSAWILANIVAPDAEPLRTSPSSNDISIIMGVGMVDSGKEATSASAKLPYDKKTHVPNCKVLYSNPQHWDLLQSILAMQYSKLQLARWLCAAVSVFAEHGKLSHTPICDMVITTVTRHADNPIVCAKTLTAVGSLAIAHPENSARLTRQQACEITNQILSTYSEGEAICIGAYHAIHGLAFQNTVNQQRFCNMSKLCVNLARSLFYELESEIVSERGCEAIAALASKHSGNQYRLSSTCNYLADIIAAHKQSPRVITACLKAMSVLCHGQPSNRNKLGALEACELVPQCMVMYIRQPSVLVWAIRAIADLAANNPNNQIKLGNNGACEALVAIVKMIATEDDTHAVAAINASTNTGTGQSSSPFGFSFLTNTQPFSGVPFSSLSGTSSNALAGLSSGAENRASAIASERRGSFNPSESSKWPKADDRAVQVFPFTAEECEVLAKWVMWAIGNVIQLGKGAAMTIDENSTGKKGVVSAVLRTNNVVWNTTRLGDAGVADATLALVNKYQDSAVIVQWSARAINNMGRSRTLSSQLLEKGSIQLMDSLLVTHGADTSTEYWLRTAKETLLARKESISAAVAKDESSGKTAV